MVCYYVFHSISPGVAEGKTFGFVFGVSVGARGNGCFAEPCPVFFHGPPGLCACLFVLVLFKHLVWLFVEHAAANGWLIG